MVRLLCLASVVAVSSLAGCIDTGPPTYQLDASWTATAHRSDIADDRISVALRVTDPTGASLDWQRVPGYDGQQGVTLQTDASSVRACARLEYVDTITVEPPPWCSGSACQEYDKPQHSPLGDEVCVDVALTEPELSATLVLALYGQP